MKRFSYIILVVSILCISAQSYSQVGIGTTTPASSSMLEIQSTAKGVLIPRMTTAQRTVIASPANGLLVFDTDKKSFWFYNGTATTPAWKELVTGSSISDTDGDTKVEVEKTADEDKIRLSTANAAGDASLERMTIDKNGKILLGTDLSAQATTYFEIGTDGVIKLGNKGASTLTTNGSHESDATGLENYTKITADGSLSYVGNATRWEDLKVPITSTNRDGSKPPAYYFYQDSSGGGGSGSQGVFAAWFDYTNEEEVYFMVQMPHGWKEGSDIHPHVHWSAKYDLDGKKVQWGLEYTWANVGDTMGATVMITGNAIIAACDGSAFQHLITELPTMSGSGKTLSSMIICRLYRDADAGSADDFAHDAGLFEIDFHYQVDSDGSNQEYTKQN